MLDLKQHIPNHKQYVINIVSVLNLLHSRYKMIFFVRGNVSDFPHSLAHCISSDARMSRGVAKDFVNHFPDLTLLKVIKRDVGLAVPVRQNNRFIYSLITKKLYYSKPLAVNVGLSLYSMKQHAVMSGVTKIGVPLLGSGLDKLDFSTDVLPIIEDLFSDGPVDIHVHALIDISVSPTRYVFIF